MYLAQLLGGSEIKGIKEGIVIVNGEELPMSYEELTEICGNIPIHEVEAGRNSSLKCYAEEIVELGLDYDDSLSAIDLILQNHLLEFVSYSEYEIDFENRTLVLKAETF